MNPLEELLNHVKEELDGLEDKIDDAFDTINSVVSGVGVWRAMIDGHAKKCAPCECLFKQVPEKKKTKMRAPLRSIPLGKTEEIP